MKLSCLELTLVKPMILGLVSKHCKARFSHVSISLPYCFSKKKKIYLHHPYYAKLRLQQLQYRCCRATAAWLCNTGSGVTLTATSSGQATYLSRRGFYRNYNRGHVSKEKRRKKKRFGGSARRLVFKMPTQHELCCKD